MTGPIRSNSPTPPDDEGREPGFSEFYGVRRAVIELATTHTREDPKISLIHAVIATGQVGLAGLALSRKQIEHLLLLASDTFENRKLYKEANICSEWIQNFPTHYAELPRKERRIL